MEDKKLYIASEFTDPCFYVEETIKRLSKLSNPCLLLITKNIGACKPILDYCNSNNIVFMAHVTVTGLAGSKLEPGVPATDKVLKDFRDLVVSGIIPANRGVIRIDPIVPFYSKLTDINKIIDTVYDFGIMSCRISIVDYYDFVVDRMRAQQLSHGNKFQLSEEDRYTIIKNVYDHIRMKGMMLYLCAENLGMEFDRKYVSSRGCASLYEWQQLGIKLPSKTRSQRRNCTCDAEKNDLLYSLQKSCPHNCTYCYWRRKGE